ncbi:hypothetical protein IMG5_147080 [Ichthyophthirius multifiliis]|uniref:FAD/NAD(P)-binding domain-containing protein n=1 Tax=Ichthyophthirius multifiliis TaxID=5932 RepID=G0QY39_ICHMU|nr:hypothetical protein IMG5_147080 [Ichthyophthirius multifiliis]EGR29865.1 hypothetical protein IMG5_147080 [Ichthyophthirius multifiliis]|eukprot:XP_004031101.1 hypothetical protein IMG5_147080 [Ichthyophthirius multifiliis]
MKQLQRYEVCESSQIKEGQIFSYTVKDGDNSEYELLIIRYQGKLYCVGGIDTYDGKTSLKNGICFENKLYSPQNGSAFNIQTGLPELAPAIDELPRFYVEEVIQINKKNDNIIKIKKKQGKVIIYIPKYIPKRIVPAFQTKYASDFRKVVIIGSGPAAFGAIESLRLTGYTGEITLITKGTKLPYDKTKLTKSFKNLNYKNLYLRDEDWYESTGINFMLGREVVYVDKTHGSPYVLLEDGLKIEYDGLIVATGVSPEIREIEGLQEKENVSFLYNMEHHKKIKYYLESAKHITILGNSIRTMECASTIKKEFPHIDIWVVDENKKPVMGQEYGEELYDQILKYQNQ